MSGSDLVGPPPPLGEPDYELTHYEANRAVAEVEQARPASIPARGLML